VRAAERDKNFAKRATGAVGRVLAYKKKWARILRAGGSARTTAAGIEKMTRRMWEFDEAVRLEKL